MQESVTFTLYDPQQLAVLRQAQIFRSLAAPELLAVARLGRQQRIARDAFLFHQGDPADTFFVVAAGRIKLLQVTPDGHQVVLRVFTPGELLGAAAVLRAGSFPATAQALEDGLIWVWPRQTLIDAMGRHPALACDLVAAVAERVVELQDRCRELALEQVEQRVARTVLRLAGQAGRKVAAGVLIDLPLSRQDLADMTGTTLYTASRILSRWEQQGLVEVGRLRLVIRDAHGLVTLAENLK